MVDCKCPYTECENHGLCKLCHEHHAKKDYVPFCKRDKATQDALVESLRLEAEKEKNDSFCLKTF